jgi:SMC interacting uncharacterized protein involved in chromosome segregation
LSEQSALNERLSHQEISAIDVDRMNMEKKKFEDDIEQFEQQKDRIEKKNFDTEVAIGRKLTDVEKAIQRCNVSAVNLKLIPVTAKVMSNFTLIISYSLSINLLFRNSMLKVKCMKLD